MSKLGGISRPISYIQFYKQIPTLRRSISSVTLQQTHKRSQHVKGDTGNNKTKRFLPTTSHCKWQGYYGIASQNNEEDIENKKYKEVVKEHSFKVPSFGGSVWTNSPFNITVSCKSGL